MRGEVFLFKSEFFFLFSSFFGIVIQVLRGSDVTSNYREKRDRERGGKRRREGEAFLKARQATSSPP